MLPMSYREITKTVVKSGVKKLSFKDINGVLKMYEVQLIKSYFPAQDDADLRDITIGDFLQETAKAFPDNVALVDIDDNGEACSSWTYQELFLEAKKLSISLSSRFQKGEKVVVWAPKYTTMGFYGICMCFVRLSACNC